MMPIAKSIIANPDVIEKSSLEEIMTLLTEIKSFLAGLNEFPLIRFPLIKTKNINLYFAGDTHGDLKVTKWIVKHILKPTIKTPKINNKLIFLGDYVDRPPKDVPFGGVKNMLYLLCMKMAYPNKIYLLRGNHEGHDLMRLSPYELPEELKSLWGETHADALHQSFLEIFTGLPLFVLAANGIFASHGGFPKEQDIDKITAADKQAILETLWGDPDEHGPFRGQISTEVNFTKVELMKFLDKIGAKVMVRGHDYSTMGYSIYGDRVLTVFSSRRYRDRGAGGVLVCRAGLGKRVESVRGLELVEVFRDELKVKKIRKI